jgi:hypothetical protein
MFARALTIMGVLKVLPFNSGNEKSQVGLLIVISMYR